jgi:hypothetical protein
VRLDAAPLAQASRRARRLPLLGSTLDISLRTPSTGNASPPADARKPARSGAPKPARAGAESVASDAAAETRSTVDGRPAPRLPHERDESSDSGTGAPTELMRRARDDVAAGKAATDKGEATDPVYRRSLRGKTPGAERD